MSEILKIDDEAIEFLKQENSEVCYPAGTLILRKNENPSFNIILSGEVQVRFCTDEGLCLPFAHLKKGNTFGELSLLRNKKTSAEVVALNTVTVLSCGAETFFKALDLCAPLRKYILSRMAENLQDVRFEAWNYFLQTQAMNLLMNTQNPAGPLFATAPKMSAVEKQIYTEASSLNPLLIYGASGCGKFYIAQKIHEYRTQHSKEMPFTVLDCQKHAPEDLHKLIFGSETISAQSSGFGAIHLANGGVLVLRHIDLLPQNCQESLAKFIETHLGLPTDEFPRTRILCTCTATQIEKLRLSPCLSQAFGSHLLGVPALQYRKQDLIDLARFFLSKTPRGKQLRLTSETESLLFSLKYNHQNANELKEAIELAAQFTPGDQIFPNQIFTGPKEEPHSLEKDLTTKSFIHWLTHPHRILRLFRFAVFCTFSGIIALCLSAPHALLGRVSNFVIWGVWEPLLFLLYFFTGRLWCTGCPLSSAGHFFQRLIHFKLPPPQWLKKYSLALSSLGFLTIIWSEHYFQMIKNPPASALLLLSLMGFAILFSILFQRQSWCRYLCPLGALGAAYSASSVFRVRANPSVCATQCTTHECYHGSKTIEGCPVFHHPLYATQNQDCKMCFNCIHSCPHQSSKLYLRTPLQGIWRGGNFSTDTNPFTYSIFLFSLVMLSAKNSFEIALAALTAWAGGIGIAALLKSLLKNESEQDPALVTRIGFALMVLCWGPLLAYELQNIPYLEALQIHVRPSTPLESWFNHNELSVLRIIQIIFVLISAALATLTFFRIRARVRRLGTQISKSAWWLISVVTSAYAAVILWLLISKVLIRSL